MTDTTTPACPLGCTEECKARSQGVPSECPSSATRRALEARPTPAPPSLSAWLREREGTARVMAGSAPDASEWLEDAGYFKRAAELVEAESVRLRAPEGAAPVQEAELPPLPKRFSYMLEALGDDFSVDHEIDVYTAEQMTAYALAARQGRIEGAEATITIGERVEQLIVVHGSLRAAARVLDVVPGYLSRLASGEKEEPGETILRRMGLSRAVRYVLKKQAENKTGGTT